MIFGNAGKYCGQCAIALGALTMDNIGFYVLQFSPDAWTQPEYAVRASLHWSTCIK